ncbi:MAG TPA: PorP/SprF family type IX secretion system membrane protein [Brumimicrobium sp.]|nr:PorP/SprF family type IX secretion system membrane protein [Brumimicrobium sp.]
MKTKILKTALLSMLIIGGSYAQDIHFSAMDYSPLTVNPGLAGADHNLQATVNYRSQWGAVGVPYQTMAAGYDMRFGEHARGKKGFLAAGLNFNNDVVGTNKMQATNIGLSLAYHLKLNNYNKIGLGLQGAFGQRSLSFIDGKWGTQYNGISYDSEIPSGETFNNSSFSFFDVGAGFVYTYQPQQRSFNNNGTKLNIGVAAYHLNRPSVSFIKDGSDNLHIRTSAFIEAQIGISDKKMAIEPKAFLQFQGPSIETVIGTDYRFFLGNGQSYRGHYEGISLALGLYVRNKDALMSRVSLRMDGFDLGMVYDFTLFSALKRISNAKGGAEVFLRYTLNKTIVQSKSRM